MSHGDTAIESAEAGPSFHPGAVELRQAGFAAAVREGRDPFASFVHDPAAEAVAIAAWERAEVKRQAAAKQQAEQQRAAEAEAAEERRLAPELARLEAEVAEAREEAEKLAPRVRELAFVSAGVDLSGVGAYVARGFAGDIEDPEAIRAEARSLGMVLVSTERGLMYRLPADHATPKRGSR